MLATKSRSFPSTSGWAYEVKWDGARAQLHTAEGRVRVFTRRGREVSSLLPELDPLAELVGPGAVVDGELVVQRKDGSADFAHVMSRLTARAWRAPPVTFIAFDLLVDNGKALNALPYVERRLRLERRARIAPSWYVPEAIIDASVELFVEVCARGLEGLVAKRLDGRYSAGARAADWLKLQNPEHPAFGRVGRAVRRGLSG
jgi:bifunctional non-homologous end joining protein LigD